LRRNSTSQGAFSTGAFRGGGGLLFGLAKALLALPCLALHGPEKIERQSGASAPSRGHDSVAAARSPERELTPPFVLQCLGSVSRRLGFSTSVAEKTQAHPAGQQDG